MVNVKAHNTKVFLKGNSQHGQGKVEKCMWFDPAQTSRSKLIAAASSIRHEKLSLNWFYRGCVFLPLRS